MKRRKYIALVGVALICGLLAGCGAQDKTPASTQQDNTETETLSQETTASGTDAEGDNKEDSDMVTPTLTIADISSMELVSDMKIGWSLGNTLDATGTGLASEYGWGNPRTTEEMIDAVISQGFNVIRIPVTWSGHIWGSEGYPIQEEWLDRVQEVVDYAYDKGVYVILNMHHEDFVFPSEELKEENAEKIAAIWTQIANRFIDYDEHLIFEGLNEPRKIGTSVEWNGGDEEGQRIVNYYGQVFVEAVRATGGNNTERHLMVPSYAASSTESALRALELPDDDKIIVSVHAYIPYNFALNTAGTADWDQSTYDIDTLMALLDELFISKDIPVIIGEFGAMNKDNEEERVAWATYYVTEAGKIGVPCVWWDNNAFSGNGENFGLLNRTTLEFPYPDLLQALMEAAEK